MRTSTASVTTFRARPDVLARWHDAMASATNGVEIDLLRAAEPKAEIWPVGLREPLPRIGVAVWADVDDVGAALQPLLDQVYD